MIYVYVVCGLLLATAAGFALYRAERGPSMLDRTVALDVFTAILVATIAVEAAWSRRTETIPILVVLSLVGFVGSVTIARFASVEPEGEGRIRTREEVAAEDAARAAEEERAQVRTAEVDAEADVRAGDTEHHGATAEGEVR